MGLAASMGRCVHQHVCVLECACVRACVRVVHCVVHAYKCVCAALFLPLVAGMFSMRVHTFWGSVGVHGPLSLTARHFCEFECEKKV